MANVDPGGGTTPLYPGGTELEEGSGGGFAAGDSQTRETKIPDGFLAPLYRFWRPVLTADAAVAGLYFPWWQERAW